MFAKAGNEFRRRRSDMKYAKTDLEFLKLNMLKLNTQKLIKNSKAKYAEAKYAKARCVESLS